MFRFKNKESIDFNIKVLKSNHLDCIEKRIEQIEVPGRTGDLLFWDRSYKNKDLNIECLVKQGHTNDIEGLEKEILSWLESSNYETLEFKDGLRFKAFYMGFENRELKNNMLLVTLNFTAFREDL